jgi:hypothetical protein
MVASRAARAEVSLFKTQDGWEVYTQGRVGAFFSYGRGDTLPSPRFGEGIPSGGGLDTGPDAIPKVDANGKLVPTAQDTFESMRLRSGFDPNQLGVGLRRRLSDDWALKTYIAIWSTIEAEAQRKAAAVFADVHEAYLQVSSPKWGTFTAGKALELFSRGALENDVLYHDGYGVGFPYEIDSAGPSGGMIGFGVLVAFYAAGFMYATPSVAGLQLSVGIYDPTTIQGFFERTGVGRPEAEITYDLTADLVKLHLFANGATQSFYKLAGVGGVNAYGVGYGGRLEVGTAHLGVAGHWGRGLGLEYAFQPVGVGVSADYQLRFFDGYSVLGQYVAGSFDFNGGWGMSRVFANPIDVAPGAGVSISLPVQEAISAGIVYHATGELHFDVDYMHAFVHWSLGEKQVMDFLNTGAVVTW